VSYREQTQRGPTGNKEKGRKDDIEKKEEFIARGADLAETLTWLEGIMRLIQGEKKNSIKYRCWGTTNIGPLWKRRKLCHS